MIRKNSILTYTAAIALIMGSTIAGQAAIYQVSSANTTTEIQAVITSAINGDIIQFAAGTYTLTDELLIQDKGITLQGMGKATGTILQRDIGSMVNHRILHVENTVVAPYDTAMATTIDGFTVKNGNSGVNSGGNILMKETPYSVIENCIIENGTAGQGGGVSLEVGGTLRNSIVRNNTTINSSQNQGGGIYMRYGANYVNNSPIYGNWADVGGGIGLKYGGVQTDPNFSGDGRNRITNSTIANNSVDGIPAYGIYGGETGSQLHGYEAFITDSIVTFNLGASNPNDIQNITIAGGGTLTVTYTDNEAALYTGTGNISADPLFVGTGPAWDYYRLQSGSPAKATSSTSGPMGAVLDQTMYVVPEPSTLILTSLALTILLYRRPK